VTIAGRELQLRRSFLEDLERHDMAAHIAGLGRPLLVMHAPEDEVVEIAQAEQIFAAARHPKSLVALDGAGHLLMRRGQAERAAEIIAAWAAPYLG
jgi:alpha-beta hydrolase superfamily lysophospholipase